MTRRWDSPTPLTQWAASLAVLLAGGTAAYLVSAYASLPRGVPVQYVRGQPLIFELKSPALVMLPLLVQLGVLAIFGLVMLLLLWRGHPAHRQADAQLASDNARMRLAAEGIALLALVWTAIQALGAVRLIWLWRGSGADYGRIYSVALIAAIAISMIVIARTMRLVGRHPRHVRPDDPGMWRLRHLYFNPGDPSLFVQTRTGTGWTLNFGRPIAIVLLAVTLLIGAGGPYFLARYILHGRTF